MRKEVIRFRLRDEEILVAGELREFMKVFLIAQIEFESIGGKGISFEDLTFFLRERHNQFSPRQIIEHWGYFKQERFILESERIDCYEAETGGPRKKVLKEEHIR